MGEAPAIHVRDARKLFRVSRRESGVGAAFASLFHRRTEDVAAVDGISFDLARGEIVGFLGPNGAGKTTTLKMLAGLLQPTAGTVEVLGHLPGRREREYLRQITLVMGQRNQLAWDIPAADSFELNRAVYRIPPADYRRTLEELGRVFGTDAELMVARELTKVYEEVFRGDLKTAVTYFTGERGRGEFVIIIP